jgi:hypothetical protein
MMRVDALKAARASAAYDRLALLAALATGDTIGQRRAALRTWGSNWRLLTQLDPTRHGSACATARRWIEWAELFLIGGEIAVDLAAAAKHRHEGKSQ